MSDLNGRIVMAIGCGTPDGQVNNGFAAAKAFLAAGAKVCIVDRDRDPLHPQLAVDPRHFEPQVEACPEQQMIKWPRVLAHAATAERQFHAGAGGNVVEIDHARHLARHGARLAP